MSILAKGVKVTWVSAPPTGEIVRAQIGNDGETLSYLVSFKDTSGETHERWFTESELKVTG